MTKPFLKLPPMDDESKGVALACAIVHLEHRNTNLTLSGRSSLARALQAHGEAVRAVLLSDITGLHGLYDDEMWGRAIDKAETRIRALDVSVEP